MYFALSTPILAAISRTFVRFAAPAAVVLGLCSPAYSATYNISPAEPDGSSELVKSTVLVKGDLKTLSGEKENKIPFDVQVDLEHQEHLVFADGAEWKAMHNYLRADGRFDVGGQKMTPKMMANRGLIFAETQGDQLKLFSPLGSISRDYLELIDIPGNANVLASMLPDTAVEVGHKWKPGDKLTAMLLRIDAVTKSDLSCELARVTNGVATIELAGKVSGAVEGVPTEFTVDGKLLLSIAKRKIYHVEMKLREDRDIGEAQPGFSADTTITTSRGPCLSPELSMSAVMRLMERVGPAYEQLAYQSRDGRFSFDHDRRWRAITDSSSLTVLRLVEQGESIAHCRISLLPELPEGKSLSMESFQADVQRSLGESFTEFLRANKAVNAGDLTVLRLEAAGQTSGEPIRWVCYHIADDQGKQVSIVFTMQEANIEPVSQVEGMIAETFRFARNASLQARRRSEQR